MPSAPFLDRLRQFSTALSLLAAGSAAVLAQPLAPAAGPPANCIGDDPLPIPPNGPKAWLDDADRGQVLAALWAKYPVLERDGLAPQALLLWRHPDGDWRYAALIADQRRAGQTCVAASFSAAVVEPTAGLLRKYFFAGGDRS